MNGAVETVIISKINIFQINVNSLISNKKRQELNMFLQKNSPDFVLINETKLNNTHKCFFKNYNLIRNYRMD